MPYKSKLRKLQQEDPEFLESLLAVKNSPFNEDVGSFLESDGEVDVSQVCICYIFKQSDSYLVLNSELYLLEAW